MRQPEGFHEGGPNKVCRLRKSLYGLKQSARQWNIKLHTALTQMGFKRVEADWSVYIYSECPLGLERLRRTSSHASSLNLRYFLQFGSMCHLTPQNMHSGVEEAVEDEDDAARAEVLKSISHSRDHLEIRRRKAKRNKFRLASVSS
jgi:hypothetical protein